MSSQILDNASGDDDEEQDGNEVGQPPPPPSNHQQNIEHNEDHEDNIEGHNVALNLINRFFLSCHFMHKFENG